MTEMSRILNLVDLTNAYTAEVKTQLIDKVGSLDSEIFSGLNLFGISKKLIDLGVEIDQNSLDPVSKYLLAQMIEMEVFTSTSQAAQPTSPIEVNVNQAKTPEQMDLQELLEAINKSPSNLRLRQALMLLPEVIIAQIKANNRPVFAMSNRKLDIAVTTASLKWLRDGNPYNEQFKGHFLMHLDDILDAGAIQFVNPIDDSMLPTDKIDPVLQLDFGAINIDVYKGYLWFRHFCNSSDGNRIARALRCMDPKAIYQDMLTTGTYSKLILDMYIHARDILKDDNANKISIEWPKERRNYTPPLGQFQDITSQGRQNHGANPIGSELSTKQLRQLIEKCLSAHDVNSLAFDYFQPVYQNFTDGLNNSYRISSIIDYAQRQKKVTILMNAVWKICPNGYDNFMASLNPNQNSSTTVNQTGRYNVNIAHASGPGSVAIGGGGGVVMGDKIEGDKVVVTRITTGNGNIFGNNNVVQIGDNNYFK
jgi:hypothetical protein